MTTPAEDMMSRLQAEANGWDGNTAALLREAAAMIENLSRAPSDEELREILTEEQIAAVIHKPRNLISADEWERIALAALRRVSRPVQEGK